MNKKSLINEAFEILANNYLSKARGIASGISFLSDNSIKIEFKKGIYTKVKVQLFTDGRLPVVEIEEERVTIETTVL